MVFKKGMTPHNKGKSLEEIYGKKKAEEIRQKRISSQKNLWGNPLYKKHMREVHMGNTSRLGTGKYKTKEEKIEAYRPKRKKYNKKYEQKNPEKIKAQHLAGKMIKISKNQMCEICGKNHATNRHHSDYSKPLKVNLLCVPCHQEIHRSQNFIL